MSLSDSDSEPRKYRTKHGTVSTMDTARIGKSKDIAPEVREMVRDTDLVEDKKEVVKLAQHLPKFAPGLVDRGETGESAICGLLAANRRPLSSPNMAP